MCVRDFRRGAVTEMLDKQSELSVGMAELLDYSEKTAKKYYRIKPKNISTAKASATLASAMRKVTTPDRNTTPSPVSEMT